MRGVPTAMFDPNNGSLAAVKNPTISPGLGSSPSHGLISPDYSIMFGGEVLNRLSQSQRKKYSHWQVRIDGIGPIQREDPEWPSVLWRLCVRFASNAVSLQRNQLAMRSSPRRNIPCSSSLASSVSPSNKSGRAKSILGGPCAPVPATTHSGRGELRC
jgi:hypothetical protein